MPQSLAFCLQRLVLGRGARAPPGWASRPQGGLGAPALRGGWGRVLRSRGDAQGGWVAQTFITAEAGRREGS